MAFGKEISHYYIALTEALYPVCSKDQSIQRVIEEYTKTIEERESHMATLYSEYNEVCIEERRARITNSQYIDRRAYRCTTGPYQC